MKLCQYDQSLGLKGLQLACPLGYPFFRFVVLPHREMLFFYKAKPPKVPNSAHYAIPLNKDLTSVANLRLDPYNKSGIPAKFANATLGR